MTRILGIDPGSRITGYGVIDQDGQRLRYVASGCIRIEGEALAARQRWDEMGRASRAIVERDFAWSRVIARWLDLYAEVLTRRGRSA